MYELHIANKNYSSWSLRPWVLLTVLGIPFVERLHYFTPENSFRTFSPTGLVPALVDGETTVWDSLAIAEYVHENHPVVWPANKMARAFARSAAAEMHSGFTALRTNCSMNVGVRVKLKDTPPALVRDLARLDELWTLGFTRFGGPFLAGDVFTATDAFFAPVAFRVQTYGLGFDLSETSRTYVDRLLALPAMQAWYEAGIKETERDIPHEAEIAAVGEIISDIRAK
ncbi:MAG TPA: glutathione S-transferase family protein [Asticcacaulis sp.]|nr:glutathione S-transferase family protein [Asticcacaulis sp.]